MNIKKVFTIGGIGLVLTVVGIFFGVMPLLEDKNPQLDFVIETNTSVLDLKENVQKLTILYDGEDIKEHSKALSMLTIKVVNNSSVNILKTFYDERTPVGFKVLQGQVVEKPQIIAASDDYLKQELDLSVDSFGQVFFPNLILDGGAFFTVKLLVMKDSTQSTSLSDHEIEALGKVAGVKKIQIQTLSDKKEDKKLLSIISTTVALMGIALLLIMLRDSRRSRITSSEYSKELERIMAELRKIKRDNGFDDVVSEFTKSAKEEK